MITALLGVVGALMLAVWYYRRKAKSEAESARRWREVAISWERNASIHKKQAQRLQKQIATRAERIDEKVQNAEDTDFSDFYSSDGVRE